MARHSRREVDQRFRVGVEPVPATRQTGSLHEWNRIWRFVRVEQPFLNVAGEVEHTVRATIGGVTRDRRRHPRVLRAARRGRRTRDCRRWRAERCTPRKATAGHRVRHEASVVRNVETAAHGLLPLVAGRKVLSDEPAVGAGLRPHDVCTRVARTAGGLDRTRIVRRPIPWIAVIAAKTA